MTQWEHTVIRQDALDLFERHLVRLGLEGWEAVSANYVMHEPEKLSTGTVVPARAVWIAVMKRPYQA
jgi:hypothetical protein